MSTDIQTDGTAERVQRMADDFEAFAAKQYRKIEKAEAKGNSDKADRLREQLDSYGQSVRRVVTVTLAGGGPSHWLEVELDDDGDVASVWSVATWWSEPVRKQFHEGSAMWRYAEDQTSHYGRMTEREW